METVHKHLQFKVGVTSAVQRGRRFRDPAFGSGINSLGIPSVARRRMNGSVSEAGRAGSRRREEGSLRGNDSAECRRERHIGSSRTRRSTKDAHCQNPGRSSCEGLRVTGNPLRCETTPPIQSARL